MDKSFQPFRDRLEEEHSWPDEYMFKFIVPKEKEEELKKLFPALEFILKKSSRGNYISFTARVMIESTDQVIQIYEEAHKVKGLIAL
jgi:putative lipoic acid-binding regulatory protein